MTAAKTLSQTMSLNKSLHYCGLSKTAWYHSARPRDVALNRAVSRTVQEIGHPRMGRGAWQLPHYASCKLR